MKTFKGKACAKVILLGEHFVVTGAPALAFPLHDLWTEVSIQPNSHPHYSAVFPGNEDPEVIQSVMARAVYAASDALRVEVSSYPFTVRTKSNFPVSRGLGSSASFAVALARALGTYRHAEIQVRVDDAELIRAAHAVEKVVHGTPSGIDAATVFGETAIRFEKGEIARKVKNNAVDLVVVDGGPRDNCDSLISRVAKFREANAEQWHAMMTVSSDLVASAEESLRSGDAEGVAACVRKAQGILVELGLGTPTIDDVIAKSMRFGALAGKVSGAGGGGAVVLVAPLGAGRGLFAKLKDAGLSPLAVVPGSK
jgi:mevalonate kinase